MLATVALTRNEAITAGNVFGSATTMSNRPVLASTQCCLKQSHYANSLRVIGTGLLIVPESHPGKFSWPFQECDFYGRVSRTLQ